MHSSNSDQPAPAALGLTLLRVVSGVVIGAHAIEKLAHLGAFQGELFSVGVPRPEFIAFVILALELGASLMLVMGRFTRVAALATLGDALFTIVFLGLQQRAFEAHGRLESAALMGAAAFYLLNGGYDWSDLNLFSRRSRLQAEAALWQRPQTATAIPATLVYETPEGLVYEAPLIAALDPDHAEA